MKVKLIVFTLSIALIAIACSPAPAPTLSAPTAPPPPPAAPTAVPVPTAVPIAAELVSPPNLILVNGKIATVDPKDTMVQAVAIRDGKILATGTNEKIR